MKPFLLAMSLTIVLTGCAGNPQKQASVSERKVTSAVYTVDILKGEWINDRFTELMLETKSPIQASSRCPDAFYSFTFDKGEYNWFISFNFHEAANIFFFDAKPVAGNTFFIDGKKQRNI